MMELGTVGIWDTWDGPEGVAVGAATEMESLGYSTLWSSAGFERGLPDRFRRLLEATTQVPVASGSCPCGMPPPPRWPGPPPRWRSTTLLGS
jgi:hypothetical protein